MKNEKKMILLWHWRSALVRKSGDLVEIHLRVSECIVNLWRTFIKEENPRQVKLDRRNPAVYESCKILLFSLSLSFSLYN